MLALTLAVGSPGWAQQGLYIKICAVERVEGLLSLHGVDAYHGWSIVIGETGKMSRRSRLIGSQW